MFICLQTFADPSAVVIKSTVVIKNAELTAEGEVYKLNADLEITFDEKVEEAINKGVPLCFIYEFQLVNPREYWFDDEIVTASTNITVSYHALSRQYLVSQDGRQTSHEILREAMIELVQLYDWTVLDKAMLEEGIDYKAALLVRLDQSKLPKAIQVEAIGSEDWKLTSETFKWLPKDLSP